MHELIAQYIDGIFEVGVIITTSDVIQNGHCQIKLGQEGLEQAAQRKARLPGRVSPAKVGECASLNQTARESVQ
jgi:hypothetical protein